MSLPSQVCGIISGAGVEGGGRLDTALVLGTHDPHVNEDGTLL